MAGRSIVVGSKNPTNHGSLRNGLALRSQLVNTLESSTPRQAEVDLSFENHGSLFLIRPLSDAGQTWLDENIGDDAQVFGNAIVCEPKFVEAIFRGATSEGLVCR